MDDTLYILDDSQEFTDAVADLLEHKKAPFKWAIFNEVDDFEKNIKSDMMAVILDFYLPKKTGLEVMKKVRAVSENSLIIFVSNSDYTHLPLAAHRDNYVTFVGKGEENYVSIIVDLVVKHFNRLKAAEKLAEMERSFIEDLKRQGNR